MKIFKNRDYNDMTIKDAFTSIKRTQTIITAMLLIEAASNVLFAFRVDYLLNSLTEFIQNILNNATIVG
ncbi:MAG: hypothetical protein ACI4DP_03415 [Candidatus Ornithomonoglobus sp.]